MNATERMSHNMDLAIAAEWRKCLLLSMLLLYEKADYTADGLKEFRQCFVAYLRDVQQNHTEIRELDKEVEEYIGYHLGEVRLSGTPVNKMVKTTHALCIKIGAVILYKVAEWERDALRDYVRQMWDYIRDYSEGDAKARINRMLKETKIKVKF